MYYLLYDPLDTDQQYVQIKVQNNTVVCCTSWYETLYDAITTTLNTDGKDRAWEELPELLHTYELITSSPDQITPESHHELLI